MNQEIINTKEFVKNLTIVAGQSNGSVDFKPLNGHIIGCVVYTNGAANPGFVQAKLENGAKEEISRMQHIDNYRSRNAEYLKGCKPLNIIQDGDTYTFTVQATAPFAADFLGQIIIIYKPNENCKP